MIAKLTRLPNSLDMITSVETKFGTKFMKINDIKTNNSSKAGVSSMLKEALTSCFESKRGRTYVAALITMLLLALLLPFANILFIYPAFTDILVKGTEEDAKRLGRHMLPPALKHTKLTPESLNQRFFGNIYKLENDYGLMKIKIFSAVGEVIYSTTPAEIGQMQTAPFFFEKVTKGNPHSKLVSKNKKTMEGETVDIDVVETYVPYMRGDTFLGAFEMYYDVTKRKQRLDQVVLYSRAVMYVLSFCLFVAAIFLFLKEASHLRSKNKAYQLKQEVERITRHDIKSPLIGILTGIEYLEQFTELTGEQADLISEMRISANTSMEMINRSMDIYKMESGTYQYTPIDSDLVVIVHRSIKGLKGLASTYGVELRFLYENTPPADNASFPFQIDETLYFSLISNLLKNAIEASSNGDRVTIKLTPGKEAHITIHNPGMVPEDMHENFFEKYATAGKQSGTGLGRTLPVSSPKPWAALFP